MLRSGLIWAAVALLLCVPIMLAANSPQLAWRSGIYIGAGFAGIVAMGLLLVQPLLALGVLPRLQGVSGRQAHRVVGVVLVLAVLLHVAGLWITSPPDVIDALLLRSPTPFSIWGVLALWAVFTTAGLAVLRRRLRPRVWQILHICLALVIGGGTVAHVLLIEGTMEVVSKIGLSALVMGVTVWVVWVKRALI